MQWSLGKKAGVLIATVLLFDQILKIYIKTHFYLGEEVSVFGNWFLLHFTENPGMAFGWEIISKLFLSLFRIVAVILLGWFLLNIVKQQKYSNGFVYGIALIFAGAVGNIIDSLFYGLVFSESSYMQIATFLPEGGGYAGFLQGKVVDMLYFPIITAHYPSWFPFWANQEFIFFSPVFNIADSSITIGVAILLLFHRKEVMQVAW